MAQLGTGSRGGWVQNTCMTSLSVSDESRGENTAVLLAYNPRAVIIMIVV